MMNEKLDAALNKLARWRSVFAGWQLGTRTNDDSECQAVRDHRELSMMLRIEQTAMLNLLIDKGIITLAEFEARLLLEAEALDATYQKRFPGFKSTDVGMEMNVAIARDTTAGWRK